MIVLITVSTVGVDIYNHYCSHTGSHTISLYQKTQCADETLKESASCCEEHASESSCCAIQPGESCEDNSLNDCLCSDKAEHIIIEQPLAHSDANFNIPQPVISYELVRIDMDQENIDEYRLYIKYQFPKIIHPISIWVIQSRYSNNIDGDALVSLS